MGLANLYALRSHLDAVILAAEAEIGLAPGVEPGSCPSCKAPAEQVRSLDTLDGTKHRKCSVCGHEWTP